MTYDRDHHVERKLRRGTFELRRTTVQNELARFGEKPRPSPVLDVPLRHFVGDNHRGCIGEKERERKTAARRAFVLEPRRRGR